MGRPVDPNSLRARILELHAKGKTNLEIVEAVGCRRAYIHEVIHRCGLGRNCKVKVTLVLSGEEMRWLDKETRSAKITTAEMLRAIVIDAMQEEA